MARLFFALWPDAVAAAALERLAADLARRCGGREVPVAKIHLTLAFLGEVAAGRVEAATQAGDETPGSAFSLALDTIGSFRAARVAWAGAARPSEDFLRLQGGLARSLRALGFTLEERSFAPHVTLVRRIDRPVRAATIAPIPWNADRFELVRSEPGTGRYATVCGWPLAGS